MKMYNLRYLLAGIVLAILAFLVSLFLWPSLQRDLPAMFQLAAGVLIGSLGLIYTVRELIERRQPAPDQETPTDGSRAKNRSKKPFEADPKALRAAYLNSLFEACDLLSLAGVNPEASSDRQASLDLSAVYTALLTKYTGEPEQAPKIDRQETIKLAKRPFSALEMLNRHGRLALLGDPGSGKSTFVSFVIVCMAGEMLNRPNVNLKLLRQPLAEEARTDAQGNLEQEPQPWDHGPLLPVRIVLRDLAARGLPEPGGPAGVEDLCHFLEKELETLGLGSFVANLRNELLEKGGLVMFDGLDEVPEAEQRRAQIKQIVEGFAVAFPRCRVLVTSRPYAYQEQEWCLANFTEATLAPFSAAQIAQFIERWYAQIAMIRKLNPEDARGKAEQLKKDVLGSERLRGLAGRPLLLTLMASLHAWGGGALPEKREELYSAAVDLLLDRWEAQRVVRDAKGALILAQRSLMQWLKISDRQRVRDLLNRLAFEAHRRQPELSGTADVPEGDLLTGLVKLSEREHVDVLELRNYLSQRAGLLVPRGDGVYTFQHRTFQEYLAACYLNDHDYPDNIVELVGTDYERWREVALLAGAKAARGMANAVWFLVDALCYDDVGAVPGDGEQARLWSAHLAGQELVENADLTQVAERNISKLDRVRGWLVHFIRQSQIPPSERVLAGDNLARLGDPRFDPDLFHLPCEQRSGFIEIPEGEFFMGSNRREDPFVRDDEPSLRKVNLPAFYLARYPTTTAQFRDFVEASGYQPANPECQRGPANHPVVWVAWQDALAYCKWLNAKLWEDQRTPPALRDLLEKGFWVSLPTEAEWEKAARGANLSIISIYPWGDEFDINRANVEGTGIGRTSAVGCFPRGASPFGVLDMGGNVWEWTRSLSTRFPDVLIKALEEMQSQGNRILKGGSWRLNQVEARCASRVELDLEYQNSDVGFRICLTHVS